MVTLIVIFIALILLYSLVSSRIERTKLTAPIVFARADWRPSCLGWSISSI
jgi:hypothetical protein